MGVFEGVVPESDCFCRVSIQREAADQIGFLGGVACRHLNSRTACYRMRVVGCRSGSNSQQRSDVKCRKSRMQQKECEDTWGDFEVQPTATRVTQQPKWSERGRSPTFSLRDPRRGDWIYTRNNFTRPTAAVPLATDLTRRPLPARRGWAVECCWECETD